MTHIIHPPANKYKLIIIITFRYPNYPKVLDKFEIGIDKQNSTDPDQTAQLFASLPVHFEAVM